MKKKSSKKKIQKKGFALTPLTIISGSILLMVALLIVTVLSYQVAYLGKIYPGVNIGGVNIGNKTKTEARVILDTHFTTFKKAGVAFSFNNEVKNYQADDLGINFQPELALDQAYRIGREENLIHGLVQKIKAWKGDFDLNPNLTINETKVDEALNYFAQKIPNPPLPVKVSFLKNIIEVREPTDGELLDINDARSKLFSTLNTFSVSPIPLKTQIIQSRISSADLQNYRQKLQTLVDNPLKLAFGNRTWTLKGEDLAKLVAITSQKTQQSLNVFLLNQNYQIEKIHRTTDQAGNFSLDLNPESLDSFVKGISHEINQEPKDAKFTFTGGRVSIFSPSQDGQNLDENDTKEKIKTVFSSILPNSKPEPIALKVDLTKSQVTTESVNNMGIKELIGSGTTTFFHSIPNRAANIALASSRINGTLVAPGEIFSMSKTVGEVDSTTGYKEAYIISEGKTQLDFGGGVCQVSTTLFRTALNSGLPIVERHPHAYRVGYYEQNSPAGIDASVYFPNVDFKFKNDTKNYILIQTIFEGSRSALTFNFYGTNDGRRVTMTKPVISNQTPPPPDLNQDDPTLPLGTVKQVDFAAWGATTNFSRTVTRNGEVIISDSFYSRYQPWRAIYLHGTKIG